MPGLFVSETTSRVERLSSLKKQGSFACTAFAGKQDNAFDLIGYTKAPKQAQHRRKTRLFGIESPQNTEYLS